MHGNFLYVHLACICFLLALAIRPSAAAHSLLGIVMDLDHEDQGAFVALDALSGNLTTLLPFPATIAISQAWFDRKAQSVGMIYNMGDNVFSLYSFSLQQIHTDPKHVCDIHINSLHCVRFDDKQSVLYGLQLGGAQLTIVKVDPLTCTTKNITAIPSVVELEEDAAAFDTDSQTYYFIAGKDNESIERFGAVNVSSGEQSVWVPVSEVTGLRYMQYNPVDRNLYSVGGDGFNETLMLVDKQTAELVPLPASQSLNGLPLTQCMDFYGGIAYVLIQEFSRQKVFSLDVMSGEIVNVQYLDRNLGFLFYNVPSFP
jgi:hypothetical protein